MVYLDPDGLFGGDRLAKVSLEARLHFPYLLVAANDHGRLELDYYRIVGRVYSRFPEVPSKEQLTAWLREYADSFLLFVYEAAGGLWGQWDISERLLPRYKSKASLASPDPGPDYIAWKERYAAQKTAELKRKPIASTVFVKPSEKLPKSSAEISHELSCVEKRCVEKSREERAENAPLNSSTGVTETEPDTREWPPQFYELATVYRDAFLEMLSTDPVQTGRFEACSQFCLKVTRKRIGPWNLPDVLQKHKVFRSSRYNGTAAKLEELRWFFHGERWRDPAPESPASVNLEPTPEQLEKLRRRDEELAKRAPDQFSGLTGRRPT